MANRWHERMGINVRFPAEHAAYSSTSCHARTGRSGRTPLLLQYGPGDYNCLHQDLYGDHVFPLQVAVLLSQPARSDFTGGEFILTEQRPRMQSRASVVPLGKGDAVVFGGQTHDLASAGEATTGRRCRHGVRPCRSGQAAYARDHLPRRDLRNMARPAGVRTCDLMLRRHVLYPAELRARVGVGLCPARSAARPNGRPRIMRGSQAGRMPGARRLRANNSGDRFQQPFEQASAVGIAVRRLERPFGVRHHAEHIALAR